MRSRSVSGPLLLAFDGSDHAASAVRAAGAGLPGREALVLTMWISMRDAGAATRLALPGQVVADGIDTLDEAARDDARHVAEEGVRLAHEAGLRARPIEAARRGTEANTIIDV